MFSFTTTPLQPEKCTALLRRTTYVCNAIKFFLKDKANLEFIILFTLYWQEISASSAHYLSHTKISQTKCYKQYDTSFQFSFHCSFRCCAPFCLLCCPLRPLLLIGGKLSTANQDPPKDWF